MTAKQIHLDDEGTIFELTIFGDDGAENISTATVKNLVFQFPSGTISTKAGVFTTDGTDGKIRYTAVTGFINELGTLRVQAQIETPLGKWKSSIHKYEVLNNLA